MNELKKLFVDRNMSMREMSKRIGYHPTMLGYVLNRKKSMPIEKWELLANKLEMSLAEVRELYNTEVQE